MVIFHSYVSLPEGSHNFPHIVAIIFSIKMATLWGGACHQVAAVCPGQPARCFDHRSRSRCIRCCARCCARCDASAAEDGILSDSLGHPGSAEGEKHLPSGYD